MIENLEKKQSHEFFIQIENKLMEVINSNMCKEQGFWTADGQFKGCFVQVDVKVNDFYIPDWLRRNLKAVRKARGVEKKPIINGTT